MHFTTTVVAALATLSAGVSALGSAKVVNNCNYSVWLTINRPNVFGQPKEYKSKATYSETYKGTGNSIGITKNANFYSSSTPKLIFGYSDSSPTVYYSVSSQDGTLGFGANNAAGFTLAATGGCKGTKGYNNGMTMTCSDANSLTLTLCG